MIRRWFHHGNVISGQVDLHMIFIKKIKKIHEKTKAMLKKYADKNRIKR